MNNFEKMSQNNIKPSSPMTTQQQDKNSFDIDDVFDRVIHLEKHIYENGRELGKVHGEKLGKEEGFNFGVDFGRKIGKEIGSVLGLCTFLKGFLKEEGKVDSTTREKISSTILQIENVIKEINWENLAQTELEQVVENLRNKRKLLEIRAKQIIGKVVTIQKKEDYSF